METIDLLQEINRKLDLLLAANPARAATAVPTPIPAYALPPLDADNVIADGVTFNLDGSVWITSTGESGPPGTRVRVHYGYFTPEKNPETFRAIAAIMGPANYVEWMKGRDPWAVYSVDIPAQVARGVLDFVSLGYILQPFGRHVVPGGEA